MHRLFWTARTALGLTALGQTAPGLIASGLIAPGLIALGLIVLCLTATSAQATGPSFPCGGHLTPTERAICHDPGLARLDRTMARHYYINRDLSSPRVRRALQGDQKLWLRWRDTCGADARCLQRRYEQRIIDLVPPRQWPPGFGCGGGHADPMEAIAVLPPT